MELIDMIVLGLVMILGITLSLLAEKNRKLHHENEMLKAALKEGYHEDEEKTETVLPKMQERSEQELIAALIGEGKTVEEIARILHLPIDKVELIIKFEKIKKDHDPS